jgi:nanoRNase/pAp phosphatase (c-di-AMP/oligoRNAs hydrolase)
MKRDHKKKVREKLEKLLAVLKGKRTLLIVMQDFPDPDAIAAAAALRELVRANQDVTTTLACGGFVGRAENRALLKYLGLNIKSLDSITPEQFGAIALVDTQPGAGNNALGREIVPDIVIDHHPMRSQSRQSAFFDIRRRYGATSTILYEYTVVAGVDLPLPVATALLYGIRSDTADLGREAVQEDIDAYLALYPNCNKRVLGRIAMARVPRSYFHAIAMGLNNAHSAGNCVYTLLGSVDTPDIVSEIADLLLRDEETTWALCVGAYGNQLLLSMRTSDLQANAGKIMSRVVGRSGTGGGHSVMAGGQIPIASQDPAVFHKKAHAAVNRYLRVLGNAGIAPASLMGDSGDHDEAAAIWR